jgi:isopenicillin N synthase-like dioxygenase
LGCHQDILTLIAVNETITFAFSITHLSPGVHSTTKPNLELARIQVSQLNNILTKDYGTITLLFQDGNGGLEILSPKGEFVPATPIPDTIVVNAADLLQRWSNDIIRSTEHRVVSPPDPPKDGIYPARYSVAYFCNPNWDATINVLEGCYGETAGGKEKRYGPINAHQYLVSRLKATY